MIFPKGYLTFFFLQFTYIYTYIYIYMYVYIYIYIYIYTEKKLIEYDEIQGFTSNCIYPPLKNDKREEKERVSFETILLKFT